MGSEEATGHSVPSFIGRNKRTKELVRYPIWDFLRELVQAGTDIVCPVYTSHCIGEYVPGPEVAKVSRLPPSHT
jgi:hypothetical protein